MNTPETSTVTWGGTEIAYSIRRSARRKKTVAVTVEPGGSVLIIAPSDLGTEELDAIVTRKAPWIARRAERVKAQAPVRGPREFVSGESVLYLGRHYRLKVLPGETGNVKLRGGWVRVPAPSGEEQSVSVRTGLVSWFRHHARNRLPERVEAWQAKVGVAMPLVIISDQQKRWGSCDGDGRIRLNWRIIQAPMRLIDYVVVHELVHLKHRGHGQEFWRAVGRVMPDYEGRQEQLRRVGAELAW